MHTLHSYSLLEASVLLRQYKQEPLLQEETRCRRAGSSRNRALSPHLGELLSEAPALSHPFPTPNLSGLRSQASVGWTLFFGMLWWLSMVGRCLLSPSQEVRQHLHTLYPRHSYICLRELVHTKHPLIDPSTKLSTFKQKLKF